MDDFSKQKIIYPETTQGAYFALDEGEFFVDKTCFFLITEHPRYLIATLSSKLFEYAYKNIFSSIELGTNGYQYNKHAFVLLPVIEYSKVENSVLNNIQDLISQVTTENDEEIKRHIIYSIDSIIYSLYGVTDIEKEYIENAYDEVI